MIEHLHTTILVATTSHQPNWLHNIHIEMCLCQNCLVYSTTLPRAQDTDANTHF